MWKQLLAAIIFFTRLPLWRIKSIQIPSEYYKQMVNIWPVAGWLTGGVMAGTLWLASQFFPFTVAVLLAITARLLLTGALHEDGFADYLDGFGGGTSRERILAIMKDSHIGVYGVIGLILYFLLISQSLIALGPQVAVIAILVADPFTKFIGSHVNLLLPYARTAETSKIGLVYKDLSFKTWIVSALFGLLPLLLMPSLKWLIPCLLTAITIALNILLMKKKINGYTGDCCGALFIIGELIFYLTLLLVQ